MLALLGFVGMLALLAAAFVLIDRADTRSWEKQKPYMEWLVKMDRAERYRRAHPHDRRHVAGSPPHPHASGEPAQVSAGAVSPSRAPAETYVRCRT